VVTARRAFAVTFWTGLSLALLGGSAPAERSASDQVHRFTAPLEFDFAGWTLAALEVKVRQDSVADAGYLSEAERTEVVRSYIELVDEANRLEGDVERLYADPDLANAEAASADERAALAEVRRRLEELRPATETILQDQAAVILDEGGLTNLGAPFPPVAFHMSQLPLGLVVSPRSEIRQDALITLLPDLTIEQQVALEQAIEEQLGVSALVVQIGGIGTYPTMIEETTALDWLAEVIVHEWTHNYLTLRPLGLYYDTSPETRTMNETAANLIGKTFGRWLIERYYPERLPPAPVESVPPPAETSEPPPSEPPAFDFNAEMHETRVEVDRLLAEGKIDEAESYMEQRRQSLLEHGYVIRRLNQAYFAFHGAYADAPQGAAGADPVGEAVRELWARSPSPAAFLRSMAWMNSFETCSERWSGLTHPELGKRLRSPRRWILSR
jgi:hypothetical protein